MKKIIIISTILAPIIVSANYSNIDLVNKNSLLTSFQDDDLDGVENSFDRCPNTDILDTVDSQGCSDTQEPTKNRYTRYTVSMGFIYNRVKYKQQELLSKDGTKIITKDKIYNSYTMPFNLFIINGNWLYSITTGVTKASNSSTSIIDTSLEAGYVFSKPKSSWQYTLKAGVTLPTSKQSHKTTYDLTLEINKSFSQSSLLFRTNYKFGNGKWLNFDLDYSYYFKDFTLGAIYSFSRNLDTKTNSHRATIYTSFSLDNGYSINLNYSRNIKNTKSQTFGVTLSKSF